MIHWASIKILLSFIVYKFCLVLSDLHNKSVSFFFFSSQKIKDRDYVNTVFRRGLNNKITSIFPAFKDNKIGRNNLCERILECIDCSEPVNKYFLLENLTNLIENSNTFTKRLTFI